MRDACLGGSLDALRERVQTSASILDSALDCIITIDGSGKICSFNPAAERTFGYRREQALGRELADLIIPEPLRERHREGLARLAEGGHGRILDQRLELETSPSRNAPRPSCAKPRSATAHSSSRSRP
jgi:PAS domain-containing protein